jgi:hypothetical protein
MIVKDDDVVIVGGGGSLGLLNRGLNGVVGPRTLRWDDTGRSIESMLACRSGRVPICLWCRCLFRLDWDGNAV